MKRIHPMPQLNTRNVLEDRPIQIPLTASLDWTGKPISEFRVRYKGPWDPELHRSPDLFRTYPIEWDPAELSALNSIFNEIRHPFYIAIARAHIHTNLYHVTIIQFGKSPQMTTLPSAVCLFPHLFRLGAKYNQIVTLPPDIGNLSKLTYLDFYNNNISTLPASFENLLCLKSIRLGLNSFTHRPASTVRFNRTNPHCFFDFFGNPFRSLWGFTVWEIMRIVINVNRHGWTHETIRHYCLPPTAMRLIEAGGAIYSEFGCNHEEGIEWYKTHPEHQDPIMAYFLKSPSDLAEQYVASRTSSTITLSEDELDRLTHEADRAILHYLTAHLPFDDSVVAMIGQRLEVSVANEGFNLRL